MFVLHYILYKTTALDNLTPMIIIFNCDRSLFPTQSLRCSEGDGGFRGGEAADRIGEGLVRDACRGFPLVFI